MLLELQRTTGETSMIPRLVSKTLTADGVTYQLSPQEYIEYQRILGENTREAFGNLAGNPEFRQADPDAQVEYLSKVLTELNRQAKEELRSRGALIEGQVSTFGILKPSPGKTKGEQVTSKNVAENFRDQKFLDRYDNAREEYLNDYPQLKTMVEREKQLAKSGATIATNPEFSAIHKSNPWTIYTAAVERKKVLLRADSKTGVDAALRRWRGMAPLTSADIRSALGRGVTPPGLR